MKISRIFHREPDFIVGGHDNPYLLRWWIIPRNRFFNVYLHKFLRDDDDRALHDHPWWSLSIIIKGGYHEHLPLWYTKFYPRWSIIFRKPIHRHRIELMKNVWLKNGELVRVMPTWTIFITGPRVREWGFHCPQGFVHWKDFTAAGDKGATGKGCDQ